MTQKHLHTRSLVDAAVRNAHAAGPSVNLHKVTMIGTQFARVVATASNSASEAQIKDAIKRLNPKLTVVEGSFTSIASGRVMCTVEGIVGVLNERVVLSDANRESFKAVAGNMYMDDAEHLWNLTKTEAGDILIKTTCSDDYEVMQNLMKSVASSQVAEMESMPAAQKTLGGRESVEGGDLMSYVSPKTGRVTLGFALAAIASADENNGNLVALSRDGSEEVISRELIVCHANNIEVEEDIELEAVAAVGNITLERIREYYRRVFIRRPEYFNAFWERFQQRALF